jgi:hypothetical protein
VYESYAVRDNINFMILKSTLDTGAYNRIVD